MSGSDPEYILDAQVGYMLRRASQRHTALFQSLMPHGLTATQFAALARLAEVGATSQNQLGRLTSMDVATIKGVVERLREKGLVEQGADPDDKRRTLVALSPAAKAMMDALHTAGAAISDATLEPLSAAERTRFLHLLSQLT